MVMNPRTHPRGAPPDFTLPKPNPDPKRITNELWWLVCMRLLLEPTSRNGGVLAIKPGYHSYGSRLPNHGAGNEKTDHSIRWSYDREGPWWREYASAHDWTFQNAHGGNYKEISLYTSRLINAMKDPKDLRPDDVYAYTIGQADGDVTVEGYHERTNEPISGDKTHLWHRHDSFRRNIIGNKWAMWKALTIDMGWTYAEWLRSTAPQEDDDMALTDAEIDKIARATWAYKIASPAMGVAAKPAGDWLKDAEQTSRELAALGKALITSDQVDEQALAAALAPAVAALVVAALPAGADQISQEEVNIAVDRAFRAAFGDEATA